MPSGPIFDLLLGKGLEVIPQRSGDFFLLIVNGAVLNELTLVDWGAVEKSRNGVETVAGGEGAIAAHIELIEAFGMVVPGDQMPMVPYVDTIGFGVLNGEGAFAFQESLSDFLCSLSH